MYAARYVPSEWCCLEWERLGLPAPSSSSAVCALYWKGEWPCGGNSQNRAISPLREDCGLWVLHHHTQTQEVPHISGHLLILSFFFFFVKHGIVLVHQCYGNCWYTQMHTTVVFSVLFKIYLGLTLSDIPGSVTVVHIWILLIILLFWMCLFPPHLEVLINIATSKSSFYYLFLGVFYTN